MQILPPKVPIRRFEDDGAIPDEEWKKIISPSSILGAQKAAEKKYQDVDSDTIKHLRRRSKTDLFFLNRGILGHDRLSPYLHGHLCGWMERNQEWRFRTILLPRGHFKSTVATIGDSIRIVLSDDYGDQPWPYSLGPDCRVLICHETDGQASNFLFAISAHFMSNPLLMGLFPELVPSARKHRINRHELELPRSHVWPEPTIDTMGVGGRSQGRHYNFIKFDDLIGDKARDSDVVMEAAKQWFDNVQPFFSSFSKDHFDLIGTRWDLDDLYGHIFERYDDQLLRYIRGAEEPDEEGNPVPIFPEENTIEGFKILKKNRKIWLAQYANNPKAGATEFDKGWKRFFHWTGYNQITIFTGESSERLNIRDMDIVILYDPAMSGEAGIIVAGTDHKNRIFTLEALKEEWRPPDACDLIFKLVSRWQPRLVAIEEVLFSGLFKPWFEAEMRLRGTSFNIFPVSPIVGGKSISKEARIRGLSNYFSSATIFFGAEQDNLIWEYDHFGATKSTHMLDALAYGPEVWKKPLSREQYAHYKKEEEKLFSAHDMETGYSSYELEGM